MTRAALRAVITATESTGSLCAVAKAQVAVTRTSDGSIPTLWTAATGGSNLAGGIGLTATTGEFAAWLDDAETATAFTLTVTSLPSTYSAGAPSRLVSFAPFNEQITIPLISGSGGVTLIDGGSATSTPTTVKQKHDTAAAYTSANPVLAAGQIGWESDTGKLKFGDGTTAWNSLPYLSGGSSGTGMIRYFGVIGYGGGVGNGTADDSTAIATANTAAHANGGKVIFEPGYKFKLSSQINVTSPKVSWEGGGAGSTAIMQAFNGTGIKWNLGPLTTPPDSSGGISGLTIDGTGAGSTSVGLEYGDAVCGHFEDLCVQNFSGTSGIGIWVNNRTDYTEGTYWDATVSNCQYGVVFDVQGAAHSNSHGYLKIARLRCIGINNGQFGVVVKDGALLYNGDFFIEGNLAAGGTFINLIGNGQPSGIHGQLKLVAEQTTGAYGGASGIVISGYASLVGNGFIDLSSNGLQSSVTSGHGTVAVTGTAFMPTLEIWYGEQQSFIGGSAYTSGRSITTPAWTNSWTYLGTPVGFQQTSDGFVALDGSVHSGTAATSAFTLPPGYRPIVNRAFLVPTASGSGTVSVNSDGTVVCPNPTYTSLDGIRFKVFHV